MRIAGRSGQLTVGGRVAAEIGVWSADPLPHDGWNFEAAVLASDEWWRDCGPFVFTGWVGTRTVIWREVQATIIGSPIGMRAQGRPEWSAHDAG
jgi:hypothetical protein